MSSSHTRAPRPYYFVPGPSRHPVMAAIGLFFVILGAEQWVNGAAWGAYSLAFGLTFWSVVTFQWFRDSVMRERERSLRTQDRPLLPLEHELVHLLRGDVLWRLLHGALVGPNPFGAGLGNIENALLWPDFSAVWPSSQLGATGSPADMVEPFQTMGPFWLPTINTALLLTSGVTLTIAHHALQAGQRAKTIAFMWMTVLLGIVFLSVQGYEYYHAYTDLNLKLTSGIFGSTFFMLTGFHGFHVFRGHADAAVHHAASAKGPFHGQEPFRFRRRCLVLALRGRGVAGSLHPCLLDVMCASPGLSLSPARSTKKRRLALFCWNPEGRSQVKVTWAGRWAGSSPSSS